MAQPAGGNVGTTDQQGDRNTAALYQHGAGNNAAGTGGYVNPGVIRQAGDLNRALVRQHGDENRADLVQLGHENGLEVYQGAAAAPATGTTTTAHFQGAHNTAVVHQLGQDHVLWLNATGEGAGLGARAAVLANDHNEIAVRQEGEGHLVSAFVAGSFNKVTVEQLGTGNVIGTAPEAADGINVYGDHNTVTVQQAGVGNAASAFVRGNGNTASICQNAVCND
jgi:hypothetical protein